jgi:peptidoglycan/xylan/chitin deacetylase (PgdA/CDA1 family)
VQYELINTFTKNNIPLTVGVIIDSFGNDPYLFNQVSSNTKENKLEIANHGLDSTPFAIFDEQKQDEMLKESTNKIYEKLNVKPTVFIPPENRFNEDTKKVLIENGFTHLSASMLNDSPPFPLQEESLYRFPAVATTGEYIPSQNRILGISSEKTLSNALEGVEKYGFAVITIHPQEFSVFDGGEYSNKINSEQFKELEILIDKINAEGLQVVPVGKINQKIMMVTSDSNKNPSDPYFIPEWIKNNAGWWRDGHIDDDSFLHGIQYLINENILQIPPTTQGLGSSSIPDWIKDNAGWWAEGKISDDDFIYAVNYLVSQGIIIIEI